MNNHERTNVITGLLQQTWQVSALASCFIIVTLGFVGPIIYLELLFYLDREVSLAASGSRLPGEVVVLVNAVDAAQDFCVPCTEMHSENGRSPPPWVIS